MKKETVHLEAATHLNAYRIIERAVEDGISWGWNRAHKHNDTPGEQEIKEAMLHNVMNELCEVMDFDAK